MTARPRALRWKNSPPTITWGLHAPQISSAADASEIQPDATTSIEAAKAMKRIMRVILEKTSALYQPGRMDFSPGIERGQPQKGTRRHKNFL
jgi:hypothetical protein